MIFRNKVVISSWCESITPNLFTNVQIASSKSFSQAKPFINELISISTDIETFSFPESLSQNYTKQIESKLEKKNCKIFKIDDVEDKYYRNIYY